MILPVSHVKIANDARNRSVVVVILVRSEPADHEIAAVKSFEPARLVQTEQLFIIKEFALEEQARGLPQRAKQDPRIGGTNNFRGHLAHWPALPVTNLALEDLSRAV